MAIKFLASKRVIGLSTDRVGETEEAFSFTTTDTFSGINGDTQPNFRGMSINANHSGIGKQIQKMTFYIYKYNSPTGNMYMKVYNSSGVQQATSLPVLASSISSSASHVSFSLTTVHTIVAGDRIGLELTTDTGTNSIGIGVNNDSGVGNPTPTNTSQWSYNQSGYENAWHEITTETCIMTFDSDPKTYPLTDLENLQSGTIFSESDTGIDYLWNGTSWLQVA